MHLNRRNLETDLLITFQAFRLSGILQWKHENSFASKLVFVLSFHLRYLHDGKLNSSCLNSNFIDSYFFTSLRNNDRETRLKIKDVALRTESQKTQ